LRTPETVLANERLMFAASVSFVPGKVAFLNEVLGVVKIDFVSFYGYEFFLASFLRKADPSLGSG
jgi:hypothetical protein